MRVPIAEQPLTLPPGWRQVLKDLRASLGEGCSLTELEFACQYGGSLLDEIELRLAKLAPDPADAVFVVVSSHDGCGDKPTEALPPRGPLVWETYCEQGTRENAMRRAADLERRHGGCRIARLVFD